MDKLPLLKASMYDGIPWEQLRLLCHTKARYLLPTVELVEWLHKRIGVRKAIEIGAGCGDLGHHLKITMTDSWQQQDLPDVVAYYDQIKQPRIQYPADVRKIDAIDAIKLYKPDVVIGAWVTQWISPDLPPPGGGNMYGIREEEIIRLVDEYIVIGAEEIHKHKSIMKYPHETIDAPFVRSRRKDNKIWIWKRVNTPLHAE